MITQRKDQLLVTNDLVYNWCFPLTEEAEAELVDSISTVAKKNGLSNDDMHHIYPMILRMLKSKSVWAE